MGKVRYDYGGKVVLVTGGGSGIGASIARAFGGTGATLAIADINPDAAEASAGAVVAAGGSASAFTVDVGDEASVHRMINAVVEAFGGLDVAVNNAGIEANTVPLAELDSDNWRRVSEVNLSSVFYCMKAEIPALKARSGGVIVNTASISGLIGGYNLSAYTATKHGVVGMTKAAAMDYARSNIRINALCPGLVDTSFIAALPQPVIDQLIFAIPMDRAAQPAEIADAALWLCSDGASYVTGHAMVVDGGTSLGGSGTRFDKIQG
ncbi:MAG TPA: SDR family NAD(P)-dependent oxidoreductase [Burkholderiales bacterium]